MKPLISLGKAKITEARSPRIPAPSATGLPGVGPSALESVLKRKSNAQILGVSPSADVIVYVSPQCSIDVT